VFVKGICLLLWGILGFGGVKLIYPLFERFLADISSVQVNYQGRKTPTGTGLLVYFVCFSIGGYQWLFSAETSRELLPWLLLGSTIAAFAGWLDDQHGEQQIKGLRGHVAAFWRHGRLTTGFLKAVVLSIAGGLVALPLSQGFWHWFFQTNLLILSVNTLNLLDVRPGRAVKGFLFSISAVAPFSVVGWQQWDIWMPYLGAVLAVSRFDLQARSMLGDAGSNLLGMVFGLWLLTTQPEWVKAFFLCLFLGLHSLAEVGSISRVIERVPFLRWVDGWGRQN